MNLTPLEEEIMQLFWKLDRAFPKEIMEYISEPKPPYNTVLSTIRKLEKEGLLTYKKFGKSHQYSPLIQKGQMAKNMFQRLYQKYFDSNKVELLSYFIEEEKVDVNELKTMINNYIKDNK